MQLPKVICPCIGTWKQGSMLCVRIYDRINEIACPKKFIPDLWIYDHPQMLGGGAITPSPEQILLMEALASNDLHGRYANSIAHSLYVDLVVLNPKFEFVSILPKIYKFWSDHYQRFDFKIKSS